MTQADRVLELLQSRGRDGVSVLDFPVGFRLSGRIKDLRNAGHNIVTESREMPSGAHIAKYTLQTPTFAATTGVQEGLPL